MDKFSGVKVSHAFKEPVDVWSFPVYTVNESERGMAKSFQEISMLFSKVFSLAGKSKTSLDGQIRIFG